MFEIHLEVAKKRFLLKERRKKDDDRGNIRKKNKNKINQCGIKAHYRYLYVFEAAAQMRIINI